MVRLKKATTTVKRRVESGDRYYLKRTNAFVDPYPEVHGTLPEKMVYAELSRLGIPFLFLNDIAFNDPAIDFFKTYQADFIIPSLKVIIEVQGAHWHSTPKAIEADSFKLAVYEAFGYAAYAWWDYDIYANLHGLVAGVPQLYGAAQYGGSNSKELPPVVRTLIDSSKGIRTMNARKRKPYRKFIGTSRRQQRKVKSSYAL